MHTASRSVRFSDDLRKTFLIHALVPLIVAVVMVLVIMGGSLISNVVTQCRDDANTIREQVNQVWEECSSWLADFSVTLDMARFSSQLDYRAEVYTDVYQFINGFSVRPELYLLDADGEILFSTETNAALRTQCHSLLYWRLVRNMQLHQKDAASLLARNTPTELQTTAFWLLGHTLVRPLSDRPDDEAGTTIGYACFALPQSMVEAFSAQTTSGVVITDSFDNVFLSTIPSCKICFGKLDAPLRGQRGIVQYKGSPYYIHQTELAMPGAVLYTMQNGSSIVTMLSLVVILALVIFLTIFIASFFSLRRTLRRKTEIFDEITQACHLVQVGDLSTRLHVNSYAEFEVISDSYNRMLDSIQRLMEQSVALARETAVSRIKQLESQFNPHFLFNTLENVRYMVRMNPEAANDMIVNLATLLRYSIDTTTDSVTLAQDMDFTQRYISIMKARFGQRLQYVLNLPDHLRSARITKLIAQPIIENCLKHCMDKKATLVITVTVALDGDDLTLTVHDNGGGIKPSVLAMLREHIANPSRELKGHIGILNVHERLRLMYGEQYGVQIASSDASTAITLRFPYQSGAEASAPTEFGHEPACLTKGGIEHAVSRADR